MIDLDVRARRLVDAARAADPTAVDRARVRAALAAQLGAAVISPVAPPAPTPPAVSGVPLAKALIASALVGVMAFGTGLGVGRSGAPQAASARHGLEAAALRRARLAEPPPPPAEPVALAPAAPPAPAKPAIARAPRSAPIAQVEPVIDVPAAPPEIPAPPRSSLHEETTLLREAEIALARGDGATALRRLDELAARQPGGVLREERMAARVLALCAAGRTEEARREGEHFVAAMPASIQVPRVKGSCAFSGR